MGFCGYWPSSLTTRAMAHWLPLLDLPVPSAIWPETGRQQKPTMLGWYSPKWDCSQAHSGEEQAPVGPAVLWGWGREQGLASELRVAPWSILCMCVHTPCHVRMHTWPMLHTLRADFSPSLLFVVKLVLVQLRLRQAAWARQQQLSHCFRASPG